MKLSLSRSIWQAGLSKSLFLLLILLLSVVVALWQLIPPAVIPVSAPLREFSAQRAMQHLEVIAQKPRPMGSTGNIAARKYLVKELTAIGLQPTVQKTTAVQRFPGSSVFESGTRNFLMIIQLKVKLKYLPSRKLRVGKHQHQK